MTFRSVQWLWVLVAVPFAVIFLLARERMRERLARRFVAERLRGVSNALRPLRPWLLGAGLLLGIAALAGPLRGFVTVPLVEREVNRVVVLDVSNSMLATDVGTPRLTVAKAIARRLIDAWPGRIALVEFESVPEVVSPLTNDDEAVLALLDSIQAGEVGKPGSDIGSAVLAALHLIEVEPGAKADIVVISDGEEQGKKLDEAIRKAHGHDVTVSTVLVGSKNGTTIPLPNGDVLHDESGKTVTTQAHGETMQQLASGTGGKYFENAFGEHAVDSLLAPKTEGTAKERTVRMPLDRFQWPLALAFVALFLGSIVNRGAE